MLALAFASAVGYPAFASGVDTTARKECPTVGVVLSGGGAKGFAHLGALKVIEQAGVRIDYIGGTSIGAIVGGLYATGWTTEQIDSLIQNFDMVKAVQDRAERKYRLYYDKQTEGKLWFRLGVKNGKLQFPSAISHGQNIINLFADWTIPVHDATDFDSLYIPYFAKATDLSHGTSVKLDKGYVPEAMRASGTFPSLLTPFPIDSCIYVDGGVLDNYPVDQMRAMGADIVIGVNINSGLSSPEKLNSIVGILDQIIGFQIVKNVEAQRDHVDLEIHPDIADFNVMSFDQADSIYRKGVVAAEEKLDILREIAARQKNCPVQEKSRPAFPPKDRFRIEDIQVTGSSDYPKEYFVGRVEKELPGELSLDDIHNAISRLYATGNFTNVYYRLRHGGTPDAYVLNIIVNENPVHQYAGVGWGYDKLYGINLLLNYRINGIMRRSVFEADAVIGQSPSLAVSIFRDNGSRPSLGMNVKVGRLNTETNFSDVVDDGSPMPIPFKLRTDIVMDYVQANAYVQRTFKQRFTGGIGVEYLWMKSKIDNLSYQGMGSLNFENTYFFSPNIYFSGDTRDDKFFPHRGFYFDARYKILLSPNARPGEYMGESARGDFMSFITAQVDQSVALTDYLSLGFNAYAGLSLTEKLPFAYRFFPGGERSAMPFNLVPFYGLPFIWNQDESSTDLGMNNLITAGVRLQYSPWRGQYVTATYNYGLTSVEGSAFRAKYDHISGAGLSYGAKTPLGRLKLTGTYSPDKKTGSNFAVFFSIGFSI